MKTIIQELKKGLKEGSNLLLWGYLLRLNLPTLFYGSINDSFSQPDVLHIIGLSIGLNPLNSILKLSFFKTTPSLGVFYAGIGLLISSI